MSSALILSIIVLIIVLSMIVVFVTGEGKAKLEAARKANALLDRYRRLKESSMKFHHSTLPMKSGYCCSTARLKHWKNWGT